MKHFSLPLFLLTAFFIFSSARADDFMKDVALRFAEIWHFSPQEKLYVHTDKPYYSAGETLWFAAYLTNAATHITNTKSRYIYVELLDLGDSAVARVKILRDSVGFQGYIKLPPEMPAGMYTFRAYTYWMQNAPKEFFFAKQIFIGNDIDKRVNCAAVFGTADNNELSATLTFTDVFGLLIENCRVSVTQNWGKGSTRDFVTDKNGKIRLTLKFDETTNDKKFLHLKIKEKGFNFDQKALLPELAPDFDIQ
ncbi:MAG: hypothetical protein LBN23_03635, partial [Paludibacter sp.]|nr:hypothetical protein [Paludibacter sp.]